jgi:predicted ATPase
MITNLTIKGFKRFANRNFRIKPLTVLTGINGAGKTTLIQSLLLARTSSVKIKSGVELNGPYGMQLGTAGDVLNWESNDFVEISINIDERKDLVWRFLMPTEEALYLSIDKKPSAFEPPFLGSSREFTYLSAERTGPRNFYSSSAFANDEIEIDESGNFCAHILSTLGNEILADKNRAHPLYQENRTRLLKYEVEHWLSEITRPIEVNGQRLQNSVLSELWFRERNDTNWVKSTNMGFGVTYALPIILSGIISRTGGVFIVENPEAHLHPAGQSRIGVFLAWLASTGVQVIIETHSDHVINGIRRAVAEHSYLPSNSVILHWFGGIESEDPDGDISGISIDDAGRLSKWPPGFFDQYQLDVAKLGQIRRRR